MHPPTRLSREVQAMLRLALGGGEGKIKDKTELILSDMLNIILHCHVS